MKCSFTLPLIQQEKTERQFAVEKVVVDIFDGLSNRDFSKIEANCTPDFILLENGLVSNLDSLRSKLETMKVTKDYKRVNSFVFFKER